MKFKSKLIAFISEILNVRREPELARLSLLVTYLKIIATRETLLRWHRSMIKKRDKIFAHDAVFFINHKPFRTWLGRAVNEQECDKIIEGWEKCPEDFRATFWQWLEAIVDIPLSK